MRRPRRGRRTGRGVLPLMNALAVRSTVTAHIHARASARALATALRRGLWPRPARRLRCGRIVRTAFCWGIRGRLALPCGHAGRMTLPAAIILKESNLRGWLGGDIRRFGIISRNFMQYTEVIFVKLCSKVVQNCINLCNRAALIDVHYCNRNALFDIMCGQGGYSYG